MVEAGAYASEESLREQALLSALALPEGEGRDAFVAGLVAGFNGVGDAPRAVGLFLLGPAMAGPATWSDDLLEGWSADRGPLGIAALSQKALRTPKRSLLRQLEKRKKAGDVSLQLVAHAAQGDALSDEGKAAWKAADAETRRRWAPALVRTMADDRVPWTAMILADSDALVTAGAARALGLPGVGDDRAIDSFLEHTMNGDDPATRAASAVSIIRRGAIGLALAVEGLVSRGDERVINDVLQAMVDGGGPGFQGVVAAGLRAELPLARERAVDAAAASCLPEHRELMANLLQDEDPHVAVRAASALYLLVGAERPKK